MKEQFSRKTRAADFSGTQVEDGQQLLPTLFAGKGQDRSFLEKLPVTAGLQRITRLAKTQKSLVKMQKRILLLFFCSYINLRIAAIYLQPGRARRKSRFR